MYKKTVLDNGIRVITEEIPYVRSVTIGFWVRAGSRHESNAQNGISHLIEHLLFKGTRTRNAREIAEVMDATGGQLNAFTTKEFTCYFARVLDGHLPLATEILADMLTASTFPEGELDKERGVILEEIKMHEDTPDELVHDLFAASVFGAHPLAQSVLGTVENIVSITRDQMLAYMHDFYTADNLVIAVAGHVSHEEVLQHVQRHLSTFDGRARSVAAVPVVNSIKETIRHKDTEQVHLCLGAPGMRRDDPDRYALFVLDAALGGGMSSRLFQGLREERGLVYSTYSYHTCFHESGIFTMYAGTSPAQVNEVVDIIRNEARLVAANGIAGDELMRAKEQIKGSLMLSLENTANRMSRLAKAEVFNEATVSPDELMARIDAVSTEDTHRVAHRLFGSDRLALTAIGPPEPFLAGVDYALKT